MSYVVRRVHVQGYRMTFEFGNRPSSLGNLGGGGAAIPPIGTYCQPDPIGARVKSHRFPFTIFAQKNRTDFNNTTCYPCLPSNHLLLQRQRQCDSHPTLAICIPNKTISKTRLKMLNSTLNYSLKVLYFVLVVKRHKQNTYVTTRWFKTYLFTRSLENQQNVVFKCGGYWRTTSNIYKNIPNGVAITPME